MKDIYFKNVARLYEVWACCKWDYDSLIRNAASWLGIWSNVENRCRQPHSQTVQMCSLKYSVCALCVLQNLISNSNRDGGTRKMAILNQFHLYIYLWIVNTLHISMRFMSSVFGSFLLSLNPGGRMVSTTLVPFRLRANETHTHGMIHFVFINLLFIIIQYRNGYGKHWK